VRTLVISDLHIGAAGGKDLVRRADLRAPLIAALAEVDRLVILGDGLELREAPHRDAGDLAAPFFAEAGAALGADGELLLLAGNHDHGLVAGWIDARLQSEPSGFLGLSEPVDPAAAGPLAQRLAELAAPARLRMAYPGVWLRDDVYALHGHYVDLHSTVPTFERLAAGAMARWVVRLPEEGARPDDYEAALAPIYAFMHQLTQRSDHAAVSAGAGASARAWVALAGDGRARHPVRAAALGTGYAAAVAVINALGLGPVDRELSGEALRRGGLRGIREVLRRLGVTAPHVVFGHTHRSGPWPRDDGGEWTTAAGTRVVNAGSWVYQPHFLSTEPNASPYWPGTAVAVDDDGPPRLIRLLGERGHRELSMPADEVSSVRPRA
jgi:Calcineurin-like phosphoesterase